MSTTFTSSVGQERPYIISKFPKGVHMYICPIRGSPHILAAPKWILSGGGKYVEPIPL